MPEGYPAKYPEEEFPVAVVLVETPHKLFLEGAVAVSLE